MFLLVLLLQNESGYDLDCDQMALFELGSISYEFYLLNIRLLASDSKNSINTEIGKPYELSVVVSYVTLLKLFKLSSYR